MNLEYLAKKAYKMARNNGYYENGGPSMGTRLMLIVSELSEALEADRKGSYLGAFPDLDYLFEIDEDEKYMSTYEAEVKGSFEEEIADTVIRVLDLCGHLEIDLEMHVLAKMRYNKIKGRNPEKAY